MKIIEKIRNRAEAICEHRPPVIAFTGDSVTQGCFELYMKNSETMETVFESDESYSEKLKKIFAMFFPSANITVVNTGISGNRAEIGLQRLKKDVISVNPDLTVVSFGLNDSNQKQDGLEKYKNSLREIFNELKTSGSEIIFMTPNMCTERVDFSIKEEAIQNAALRMAATVNEGWLDRYIEEAKTVCSEENIPVCDCYKLWKNLNKNGVDVTSLLSNKINHPIREMHWMFAYELVKVMFEK